MEGSGIVETTIKVFKQKQREKDEAYSNPNVGSNEKGAALLKDNYAANQYAKKRALNSPVLVPKQVVEKPAERKDDQILEGFDQYVLYHDLKKKAEVLNAGQTVTNDAIDCSLNSKVYETEANNASVPSASLEDESHKDSTCSKNTEETVCESAENCEEEIIREAEEHSEESENEYLFPTPEEIRNAKKPEVGMVFSTLEEAVRFVNVYGQLTGFAVVKGRNYKQRKITLLCNKSRKPVTNSAEQRKRKRNVVTKTNCQMSVAVKLVESKWHISSVFLEHNHELVSSPSLTKFFLSHRTMTDEEIMLSKLLQEIRVKPQRIMTIFRRMEGSFGKLKFGKRKLDNMKQAERKLKRNSDMACTLKYIEKIQLDKPGFCCKMDVDGEGAVRSIFWTDARSRKDYEVFGEIMYFDTTYSTNKYNMPFAPIIGINGHAKTIVFGWALLKNQKAGTFQWLFESFVDIMKGKKPQLILTDQDVAIGNAVSAVFPDAWHRFCIWHILKNLRENMSAYMSEREGMEEKNLSVILESLTITEFESGWNEMVSTYDCAGHDHIKRMWNAREKFVPAYFKRSFCPFTRTTGRSESFNSNFKDYVLRKDTIENFLKQYELFQETVVEIENADRFESTQKIPVYLTYQPIERHAASIYTRGIYLKFVTELLNSTAFAVKEVVKNEVYELKKIFNYLKPEYRRDLFTVCIDRTDMSVECECGKYEKDGILCCHILRIFTQFDVVEIPKQYIMPRWTSQFREDVLAKQKQQIVEVHGTEKTQNALRYAMLMNSMNDVCVDISRDSNKSREFLEEVHKLHKKLMAENDPLIKDGATSLVLRDPPVIQKASAKKAKGKTAEDHTDDVAAAEPTGSSTNVCINEDGSISKSTVVAEKPKRGNGVQNQKKKDTCPDSSMKDPPVSNAKSVTKGNRMKPQSEKNSKRKKNIKK